MLGNIAERTALVKEWLELDLSPEGLFLALRISENVAELLQTVVHQRYKLRRALW